MVSDGEVVGLEKMEGLSAGSGGVVGTIVEVEMDCLEKSVKILKQRKMAFNHH